MGPPVIHFFTEGDEYITEGALTNPPPNKSSRYLNDQWWDTVEVIGPSQYGEGPDIWKVVLKPGVRRRFRPNSLMNFPL